MSHGDPLLFGTIPGRVGEVIRLLYDRFPDHAHVAIRSIDSERSIAGIERILKKYSIRSTSLADLVFVSRTEFLAMTRQPMLTGFDELWFLSQEPRPGMISPDCVATSDAVTFADGIPTDVEESMRLSCCFLVLGDGCGLNYASTNESFVRLLVDTMTLGSSRV